MPEFLSENQTMIRDMVKEFAQEKVAPGARARDHDQQFPQELIKQMASIGLLGIEIPESYGGADGDTLSYLLVIEELARHCGSLALTLLSHSFCAQVIQSLGQEPQKKPILGDLAQGQKLGCYAFAEVQAGSDLAALTTAATHEGDHWILNGQKSFVTNGTQAQLAVVLAQTGSGLSLFLVQTDEPGYQRQGQEQTLGMRSSDVAQVAFENFKTPQDNLLGELNRGLISLQPLLHANKLAFAALALGLGQGALDRTLPYVKQRKAFGQTLDKLQAIRQKIGEAVTQLEAARSLTYRAARAKQAQLDFASLAQKAKFCAAKAAMKSTHYAIQCLGGYGYMEEYEVERFYRDAKFCEIGGGVAEIELLEIAQNSLQV